VLPGQAVDGDTDGTSEAQILEQVGGGDNREHQ
jgi:hypothetical protein